MPDGLEFYISAGTLAGALLIFVAGALLELKRRSLIPTILVHEEGEPAFVPLKPLKSARSRVDSKIYNRYDLPLVAFVVAVYSLPLIADFFPAGEPREVALNSGTIVVSMVVQLFLAGLVVAFVSWRKPPAEWLGLGERSGLLVFAIAPVAVLLTWWLTAFLALSGYQEWLQAKLGSDGMQEAVKAFSETKDSSTIVLLVIAAVIVAPVTEEILFRGYLYPVARRFTGKVPAILFSALVFGVAHHNAMAMVPLVFLALLLALAYEYTGSIWVPVGMHFLFNGSTVAVQLLMRAGVIPGMEDAGG